jgi:hypothetical protein
MITYTDTQLKQTLAKMLPEKLLDDSRTHSTGQVECVLWFKDNQRNAIKGMPVLDTELLHLCWLVEETLKDTPAMEDYLVSLASQAHPIYHLDHLTHATWQQRATALAKVKGIEIV